MSNTNRSIRRPFSVLFRAAILAAVVAAPTRLIAIAQGGQAHDSTLLSIRFKPRVVNKMDIGDFHFIPGQPAPVHTHIAPVFGYVSKGTIYYQVEGQEPQLLKTGDAFYEPVGPRILHFDNASKTEEAVFTDINLQREGEPFIVFPTPPTDKIDRRAFPTPTLDGATISEVNVSAQTLRPAAVTQQISSAFTVFYVAQGDVSLQLRGEGAVIYHTGETFFLPKSKSMTRMVNTSGDKPAHLIAFHLLNPAVGR